jgi:hypothetical protein
VGARGFEDILYAVFSKGAFLYLLGIS